MTDTAKLMRLMGWLSPAFPIGAYSYSHGLERVVETGAVHDRPTLVDWLEADLRYGAGRADGIFFAEAWRAVMQGAPSAQQPPLPLGEGGGEGLRTIDSAPPLTLSPRGREPEATGCPSHDASGRDERRDDGCSASDAASMMTVLPSYSAGSSSGFLAVGELAAAMRATAELALESSQQGAAFLTALRKAWPHPELERLAGELQRAGIAPTLPVSAGLACAVHEIALEVALPLYLHAGVANLINAAVRLIPLGQTDAQMALAALETAIVETAADALLASLADIGSAAFMIDIASMQHETQYTRLFRS
jgi:urease accessory protein